jgi:hypothetical protein
MANVAQAMNQVSEIPPHPFLEEPILYVSNLPAHITDEVIARTLEFCVPFRPRLIRDPATGTATGSIEFRTIERGMFNHLYEQSGHGFVLIIELNQSPISQLKRLSLL